MATASGFGCGAHRRQIRNSHRIEIGGVGNVIGHHNVQCEVMRQCQVRRRNGGRQLPRTDIGCGDARGIAVQAHLRTRRESCSVNLYRRAWCSNQRTLRHASRQASGICWIAGNRTAIRCARGGVQRCLRIGHATCSYYDSLHMYRFEDVCWVHVQIRQAIASRIRHQHKSGIRVVHHRAVNRDRCSTRRRVAPGSHLSRGNGRNDSARCNR